MTETSEPPARLTARFGERTQAVHELTREAILEGRLEAGQQVSQLALARQLGVSRTPLREALRLLEREGLVRIRGPHRMVQVSALSMSDLDELYALRVAIEPIALRLTVPTLRTADLRALDAELKLIKRTKDERVRRAAHRRFHSNLRMGIGERMAVMLATLFEHAERYQRIIVVRGIASSEVKEAEHRAILGACEAGDGDLAAELLVEHMTSTANALMAAERYAPRALPQAVAQALARSAGG